MEKLSFTAKHEAPRVEYEDPDSVKWHEDVVVEFGSTEGSLEDYSINLLNSLYASIMLEGWGNISEYYCSFLGGYFFPKGCKAIVWESSMELAEQVGRITIKLPYLEFTKG